MRPEAQEPEPVRRGFLVFAVGSIGALIAGPLVQTVRFLFPNVLFEPPTRYKVGTPDRYPPESATYLPERRIFIARNAAGIRALSAVCTHLGCVVKHVASGFNCPCHGSKFDDNGTRIAGPAPRNLVWVEVSLAEDGQLVVDAKQEVEATVALKA